MNTQNRPRDRTERNHEKPGLIAVNPDARPVYCALKMSHYLHPEWVNTANMHEFEKIQRKSKERAQCIQNDDLQKLGRGRESFGVDRRRGTELDFKDAADGCVTASVVVVVVVVVEGGGGGFVA